MSDFVGLYDGKSSFWMNISNYSCVFIYINPKFNTIKIFAVLVFSLVYTLVIPFGSGFLPPLQYTFHPRLRENDGSCCVSGCRWGFAKVSGCLLWEQLRQPENGSVMVHRLFVDILQTSWVLLNVHLATSRRRSIARMAVGQDFQATYYGNR